MKRVILPILLFTVILSSVSVSAADDKNLSVIQPVMQKMPAAMQELQARFAAKDYFGTAEKLMNIAEMLKSLETVIPENGDKANWDRIHSSMINTAFNGIGACGSKDDKTIEKAIKSLGKYKDQGHKLFIKQQE